MPMLHLYFPRLKSQITESILAQYAKCGEELGELSQRISSLLDLADKRKEKPENIVELTLEECFDVAQAAVSMAFAVADKYGTNEMLIEMQRRHVQKMKDRGYLENGN